MRRFFASYRRADNQYAAGRLCDGLQRQMPRCSFFLDVDEIQPGHNFRRTLELELLRCDAMIVIIAERWLDIRDPSGKRRLDDPNDLVRMEIRTALHRGIPVIPILIEQTKMPSARDLPHDIAGLAERHALRVTHAAFKSDLDDIANRLLRRKSLFGRLIDWLSQFSREHRAVSTLTTEIPPSSTPPNLARHEFESPPSSANARFVQPETDVEKFYKEQIDTEEGSSLTATELYEAYTNWCFAVRREPLALPTFGRELGDLGIQKAKIGGRVRYIGIALR